MGLPFSHAYDKLNCYPVRAQFHSDFKSPAYLDDMLTVSIWADRIGTASLRLRFEVVRAESEQGTPGDVLMTGSCTLVTVDRKTLRPVRIPQLLRESIAPYLEDSPSPSV